MNNYWVWPPMPERNGESEDAEDDDEDECPEEAYDEKIAYGVTASISNNLPDPLEHLIGFFVPKVPTVAMGNIDLPDRKEALESHYKSVEATIGETDRITALEEDEMMVAAGSGSESATNIMKINFHC